MQVDINTPAVARVCDERTDRHNQRQHQQPALRSEDLSLHGCVCASISPGQVSVSVSFLVASYVLTLLLCLEVGQIV